jgi:CRP-like cAMP-binding protein
VEGTPDFLSLLAPDDRQAVEGAAMRREFARGAVILHPGDDAASVFILLEGRVKITAPNVHGREAVLAFLGPGDLIGELGSIDGRPRSGGVVALEPVAALAIPGRDFRRLLETRPGVGMALLKLVATRLRSADSERADFGAYDVLGRVARRLIELSERYGSEGAAGVEITLPLTQEELAGWSGASREAVSKALTTLRGLGWVETRRRELVISDIGALRTYAGAAQPPREGD